MGRPIGKGPIETWPKVDSGGSGAGPDGEESGTRGGEAKKVGARDLSKQTSPIPGFRCRWTGPLG